MKFNKYSAILASVALAGAYTSCKNADNDFPDYEGGVSVYFATQYPVRTLVMGDDTYDTSMDNAHKCTIYSTMGGAYAGRNITVEIGVDNSLTDHLYFSGNTPVKAMPESYYKLASNTINYGGSHMGGVEVEFTDAFFADPAALTNTYVIPVVMKSQTGADHIRTGVPAVEGDMPPRTNSNAWATQPKDFVLYCVKYINKYDAEYATRGIDKVTENGTTTTIVRHAPNVEKDELRKVGTRNLTTAVYPVSTVVTDAAGNPTTLTCDLLLSFDGKDECVITSDTPGYTASGIGKFVKNGDKNSWGNKDRNALYLEYTIDFGVRKIETLDTMAVKSRNVTGESFTPEFKY